MESSTYSQLSPEALRRKRRKGFMACISCRDRKVGCDGRSPACSSCASRALKCEYLPIRKTRGPGKKKKRVENRTKQSGPVPNPLLEREGLDNNDNDCSLIGLGDLPETSLHLDTSRELIDLEVLLQQNFPEFLYPDNTLLPLHDLKQALAKEQRSPEGFVPLISQDLIRELFEITYGEITGVYPMFDLQTLHRLIAEQHAVSTIGPAGNPARWAIINTWIAMGVRCKTAHGLEDDIDCVVKAYYHNAVLVLPDLILQPANKESILALLFMAVYAESAMDHRSYVMLVTNAVRQIEFLAPRLSEVTDRCEIESCRPSLSFARLQDTKVANKYGMTPILGSLTF